MDTILQVDHLTTGFPSGKDMVKIVNDVSITIEQGSIVGIVGESGARATRTLGHHCLNNMFKQLV